MNTIMQYCQNKQCEKVIGYNKLKTASNDPSISKKMRYSQYVNQTPYRTVSYTTFTATYPTI
jgi:hypothetical protein